MRDVKFERELKDLLYYVLQYGIDRSTFSNSVPDSNKEEMIAFVSKVHKGFMLAQKNVIADLTTVLNEKKIAKHQLKIANFERNKDAKREYQNLIGKLNFQEYVFRKIIDSIAFILLNHELSDARRLYCGEEPIDITDSNLLSCVNYSREAYENNPMTFALISDLSSFIQAGDILQIEFGKRLSVIELKEGSTNEKVISTIKFYEKTKCERFLGLTLAQEKPKFKEQLFRTVKQIYKDQSIVNVLNSGHGTDAFTGLNVDVLEGDIKLKTFCNVVRELLEKARTKGYAISVIDNCLPIGVYYNNQFPRGMFECWMKSIKVEFPIYNLLQSLLDPTAYSLFLLDLPQNLIVDIVLGKVSILMSIDVKQWLNPLEEKGYKIEWISEGKMKSLYKTQNNRIFPIKVGEKCVVLEKDGIRIPPQSGMLARMFTMFSTPSSMRRYIEAIFKEEQSKHPHK